MWLLNFSLFQKIYFLLFINYVIDIWTNAFTEYFVFCPTFDVYFVDVFFFLNEHSLFIAQLKFNYRCLFLLRVLVFLLIISYRINFENISLLLLLQLFDRILHLFVFQVSEHTFTAFLKAFDQTLRSFKLIWCSINATKLTSRLDQTKHVLIYEIRKSERK